MKPADSLQVADFEISPVWQFINDDLGDNTAVRPIRKIPVSNLTGKVVATRVQLANGDHKWALIGNIDAENARFTEHFMTLSVERNGKWFHLARYHDFDHSARGPDALARFLDLRVDSVFPISYDVRRYARGNSSALAGIILKEPREKLTRPELIAMAVSP